MDDIWLMAIVYLGVLLFALIITIVMVLWSKRLNRRRLAANIVKATAKVISKRQQYLRYSTPGNRIRTYYTFSYSYDGVDYKREIEEVPQRASVGDSVPIFLDPNNPEHFYVEGAVENLNKGCKRAIIIILCICAWFLLMPIVVFLLS